MKYKVKYTCKTNCSSTSVVPASNTILESDTLAGVGRKLSDEISAILTKNDYITELKILDIQPIRHRYLCICEFSLFDTPISVIRYVNAVDEPSAEKDTYYALERVGVDPSIVRIKVTLCSQ